LDLFEKLYEELFDDHAKKTLHKRIFSANERSLPWAEVTKIIYNLNEAMREEDVAKIKQLLMDAPLGYQPNPISVIKPKEEVNSLTYGIHEEAALNAV
jgi:FlaA1/EpsC-like NDP-sugar epimerase